MSVTSAAGAGPAPGGAQRGRAAAQERRWRGPRGGRPMTAERAGATEATPLPYSAHPPPPPLPAASPPRSQAGSAAAPGTSDRQAWGPDPRGLTSTPRGTRSIRGSQAAPTPLSPAQPRPLRSLCSGSLPPGSLSPDPGAASSPPLRTFGSFIGGGSRDRAGRRAPGCPGRTGLLRCGFASHLPCCPLRTPGRSFLLAAAFGVLLFLFHCFPMLV